MATAATATVRRIARPPSSGSLMEAILTPKAAGARLASLSARPRNNPMTGEPPSSAHLTGNSTDFVKQLASLGQESAHGRAAEAVVDQETSLLRENRAVELSEFNHRKQQGLLEINRILRNFSPLDMQKVDRECVRRLVRKLESNRQILAHHIMAMDEISTLVSRAMQEAESDGTYGRSGA